MSLIVDIKKRLGDFLLEVSFETEDRVTGLLGPSGCGKSMTLKCIAGVEKPDSGRIILDGETLFDSSRGICLSPQKRRVGYLFQNYALFPNMTAAQNILCGMRAGASEAEHSGADAESGKRQTSFSPGRLLNSHIQRKKKSRSGFISCRSCFISSRVSTCIPGLCQGGRPRERLSPESWPAGQGFFCWTSLFPLWTAI